MKIHRRIPLILFLIGTVLRFGDFIYNHSLWTDEAWVALDIVTRSFKEILLNDLSLIHLPAIPPIGFLILEKLTVTLWGNHEYALRLCPLVFGILAIFFYWILSKKWAGYLTAIIALSFFVFTGSLIDYSAECKQYSGEVFTAISLYLATGYFQNRTANVGRVLLFAMIGIFGLFISHTAIFILGGIAITQILFLFKDKDRKSKIGYFFVYSLWMISFILIYLFYLRGMLDQSSSMGRFCINSSLTHFMPLDGIFSLDACAWLWKCFWEFFQDPLGLSPIFLAISMFILGAFGIFKSDKRIFSFLVIPFFLMIIASSLKMFPSFGRFLLFLIPAALLFISQGISMVINKGRIGLFLGLMVFGVLIGQPMKKAIFNEINSTGQEEMRPLVGVLLKEQFPGDVIFMNDSAQYAYKYYLKYYHFALAPIEDGYFNDGSVKESIMLVLNRTDSKERMITWVQLYRKKSPLKLGESSFKQRTWIILSHLYDRETEEFIKGCFDDRGKMLSVIKEPGASLYLYELYQPFTNNS